MGAVVIIQSTDWIFGDVGKAATPVAALQTLAEVWLFKGVREAPWSAGTKSPLQYSKSLSLVK